MTIEPPKEPKRVLIVLSNTWPYGEGEQFLNDEMVYLAQAFDELHVFPVNRIPDDMYLTGDIPEHVSVYPHHAKDNRMERFGFIMQGGGRMKRKAVQRELRTYAKTMKRRTVLRYFEGKTFDSLSHILQIFDTEDLVSSCLHDLEEGQALRLVIYSYWYFVSCRVALDLKVHLEEALDGKISPHSLELITVSRGHGYDLHSEDVSGGYLPYRDLFPLALDQSYPISSEGALRLIDGCPTASEKITVARLGSHDQEGAKAMALRSSDENEIFQFVSCAYVRDVKRLDLLCQAFARLDDWLMTEGHRERRWKWTHIGGGPDLESVQAQAEKLLPEGSYHFVGQMRQQDVFKYYQAHPFDLFVNVSKNEGVPVSVMEAFSFGIPALVTEVGGTAEIVRPGISGHLLPPNPDVALVTRRLGEAILRDHATRQRLRRTTRALWEQRCNAKINYGQFAQVLSGELPLNTAIPRIEIDMEEREDVE